MHHPVDLHPGLVPSADPIPDHVVRQLMLLPVILDAVVELRQIVAGRLKSHLTVEEVAEEVGRAPYTVRTWIREGRVAAVRVSGSGPKGRLLIPRDELRKLISEVDDRFTCEVPTR